MLEYFRKQKKICLLLRPIVFCTLVASKGEGETRGTADETQGPTGDSSARKFTLGERNVWEPGSQKSFQRFSAVNTFS